MTKKTLPWDWYQNGATVTVSIWTGPVVAGKEPSVTFLPTSCVLELSNGDKWKLELPHAIRPSECKAKPAGQRLELKLGKENSVLQWAKLPEPVFVCPENSLLTETGSGQPSVADKVMALSAAAASSVSQVSSMEEQSRKENQPTTLLSLASSAAKNSHWITPEGSQDADKQPLTQGSSTWSASSQRTVGTAQATSSSGVSSSAESTLRKRDSLQATPSPVNAKVVKSGRSGLVNIGNSCFMNSSLQCLSHTRELRHYFFEQCHLEDINADNPLGFGGQLADAFGKLLDKLWSGHHAWLSPKRLQNLVSAKVSQFGNFGQHDAQEFLAFFMDGLHEDLNRVKVKPYRESKEDNENDARHEAAVAEEAWSYHRERNHSFFTENFQGQFKSTVICPQCNKVSVTFDPFMHMSVPLPRPTVMVQAYFIPHDPSKQPIKYKLVIREKASLSIARAALAKKCGINLRQLRCFTVQKGKIVWTCDQPWKTVSDLGLTYFIGVEVLSQEQAGEEVVEIPLLQRAVPPPSTSCSACYRPGVNLQRCSKCYLTSYCDRMCQTRHWRTHKQNCQFKRLPTGVPYLLSLPRSQLTYKRLAELAEHYARLSMEVDDVEPPSVVQTNGESSTCLTSITGSSSIQASGSAATENSASAETTNRSEEASSGERTSQGSHTTEQSVGNLASAVDREQSVDNLASTADREQSVGNLASTADREQSVGNLASTADREQSVGNLASTADRNGGGVSALMEGTVQELSDENLQKRAKCESGSMPGSLLEDKVSAGNTRNGVVDERTSVVNGGCQLSDGDLSRVKVAENLQPVQRFLLMLVEGGLLKTHKRLEDSDGELIDVGSYTLCLDWRNQPRGGAVNVQAKPLVCEEDSSVKISARQRQDINLGQCLEIFTDPEKLEADQTWYCPKCKEHREATKQMSLWKVPNLLVLHLKRFSSPLNKIAKHVSFPLRGLDLTPYRAKDCPGDKAMYDLYAVINHYGGSWGGHYTAFCQEESDDLDSDGPEKWLEFDDHHVSEVPSSSVVSSAAYVLFYRKRRNRSYELFGSDSSSDSSGSS